MITIDEFRKLDLRVGRIVGVEPHPNADRLLVLEVDLGPGEAPAAVPAGGPVAAGSGAPAVFGGGRRRLVAGIKASYSPPESLVGRQVIVVANLEPAKLRGVESQGMVLAAADGDRVVLLGPDAAVGPGAVVR